ncbi:MAG TPA: extensin family protein [Stellaceae bacterium]
MGWAGGWARILAVGAMLALSGCGLFGGRSASDEACLDQLQSDRVAFTSAPVHASSSACTIDNPVRVSNAAMSWSPPGLLACGFAARFDEFLGGPVEKLARRRLGSSITSMRQLGTYACRRSTGTKHRMSEHASGRAIDVAGFWLANGEFVSVEHDWHGGGRKAEFLHEFARAACGRFGVVLTPDANRAHFNHVHIDVGRWHLCGMRRADGTLPPELERIVAESGEGAAPDESVADTGEK